MKSLKILSRTYPYLCSVGLHLLPFILWGVFSFTPASFDLAGGVSYGSNGNGSNGNATISGPAAYAASVQTTPVLHEPYRFEDHTNYWITESVLIKPVPDEIFPEPAVEHDYLAENRKRASVAMEDIPSYTQLSTRHKRLGNNQNGPMLKGGISNGGISKNLLPEYPELARQLGQEGLVVLKVRISKSGNVAEVTLVQSSGYELLDLSALKRVKEWKFTPATWMGVPIESWVTIPIRFKLEG